MTKEFKGCLLIDFDGTVVEHQFPKIGPPMPYAFEVLKQLQEYGYKLILWTCREDGLAERPCLTEAIEFCRKNGIEFDSINAGIPEHDWRGGTDMPIRKPHAVCHIDDHNLGGFPGWLEVRSRLIRRKTANYIDKVVFTSTNNYGSGPENENDVYTVQEFIKLIDCGLFTDYDGYGFCVKNKLAERVNMIYPSTIHLIPEDATHIVWYNR